MRRSEPPRVAPGLGSMVIHRDSEVANPRLEFEQMIKNTRQYRENTSKFINYPDKFGKTALHYAANVGDIRIV